MSLNDYPISLSRTVSTRQITTGIFLLMTGGVLFLSMGAGNKATKQFINLDGKHPPGYTQIVTTPPGKTIYLSGMGGAAPDGTVPKDFATQADNTFRNIGRALKAGGADFKDIVKINYFVTDMGNLKPLREIRAKYLDMQEPPAATLVQVGLAGESLVEIECVAVVPE